MWYDLPEQCRSKSEPLISYVAADYYRPRGSADTMV